MNIQYAVLGLLSWREFSGYDLKKIISDSTLFYWSGNNNQIYRTLVALHADGLVNMSVEQQKNLPDRKVYRITRQGKEVLRDWLLSDPQLPEQHNSFLIQLAWGELLTTEEILSLLQRYQDELDGQLCMAREKTARGEMRPQRSEREIYLWQMISQNQISALQTEMTWLQQLRQGLAKYKGT